MQSLSTPLNRLHEDGSWFARAHELRLWLVRCDGSLRNTALDLIPKLEFHADNRSAWPLLDDAYTAAERGWQLRANKLLADWTRRVEAFAEVGVELPPVSPRSDAPAGLAHFQLTLSTLVEALREPLEGLVIVVAPSVVELAGELELELSGLLADSRFDGVRWVLVLDADVPPPAKLLARLDERGLVSSCLVDDSEQRADLAALLAGGDPLRLGMAAPAGVQPPPRVDEPPQLPPAEREAALRSAGLDPAVLDAAPHIRVQVLAAAIQMKQANSAAALEHQRKARELCASAGLTELQLITTIALASYLSGVGQRSEALGELEGAAVLAHEHGLHRHHSQAELARGLVLALAGEHEQASRAYASAAEVAEAGGEASLAIEAWRMAGQLALQLGHEQPAHTAFNEALRVATTAPEAASGSSAPEVARQLAGMYERREMTAQAASLHAQADAIEQGEAVIDAGQ